MIKSSYFQAGRSFDLPNPEKYRQRYLHLQHQHHHHQRGWTTSSGGGSTLSKSDAMIIFDSETDNGSRHNTTTAELIARRNRNGNARSNDNLSMDSCHETIKYQAVENLIGNTRTTVINKRPVVGFRQA